MSGLRKRRGRGRSDHPDLDLFDLEGSDPETLLSGRIPDPLPQHTPLFRALARMLTAVEARLRARGGTSLRMVIRIFWGVIAAIGIFLLVGPVINKPLGIDDILDSAELSEVDWVARDAEIDYTVQRADDGSFSADVDEKYTATFLNDPVATVERTIVSEFHGHDVEFELHSATVDGVPAEVSVERSPTTTVIRVQRPDEQRFEDAHDVRVSYALHHLAVTDIDDATGKVIDQFSWPLFAPTWPQATSGIEVSFTLSREVNDALVRSPRAYVGWLLLGATEWLTPEEESPEWVRYSFNNDQNLPPNADIWIHASFEPGTFTLPPTTPLFWVQTYGPLLPLVALALLLLFALAARRVVWADSVGEPWYVARSEPPDRVSPALAARLLRKPWHAELIDALTGDPDEPGPRRRGSRAGRILDRRERKLAGVARAGRRAGRLGNFPALCRRLAHWSKYDPVLDRKLRWVPNSYIRDTFVLAPIAVTLVQWGLLRQLSHQVILSIVWWPFAFVVISTALALVTVIAVTGVRPLTREGALLLQQLKGINVYARVTRLLDRGPIGDPVLGYAMLFNSPRRAGEAAVELAIAESGDREIDRGWRTERYVSAPALLALAASIAVLAGAIVAVSTQPPPYSSSIDPLTRFSDLSGTFRTQVQGFEIEAELSRDEAGAAELRVDERHDVFFDSSGSQVPQFAREWPAARFGQDLGFAFDSVRIDGKEVPHRELSHAPSSSRAVVTQLEDRLEGVHDVEFSYRLTSPVVHAAGDEGGIQQLRWTAWYWFWDDEYYTDVHSLSEGREPVRPLRIQFTLAPELEEAAIRSGWIDYDHDRTRVVGENGNWVRPWVYETQYVDDYQDGLHEITIGSVARGSDGSMTAWIDVDEIDAEDTDVLNMYDLDLNNDLGVRIDFAPDTFTGTDEGAYANYLFTQHLPYAALMFLGFGVVAASVGVVIFVRRSQRRVSASLKTVSYAAIPLAALAQCVLFFWTIGPMAGSDGRIIWAVMLGGAMWVAFIGQSIFVVRAAHMSGRSDRATRSRGRAEPHSD